jgi:phosphoribosylanthranilate isomerase
MGSKEEAELAMHYGASALGFVSAMPSGPGVIPEELITSIMKDVPPCVDTFLLTSKQVPADVITQQRRTGANTLQLVDSFPPNGYAMLKTELPGIRIIQVIHVLNEESIHEAVSIAPFVHALLLDSGNPTLGTKELGGTGRTHDWSLSRQIRNSVKIPVFLAGGLHAENVREAINQVEPYGVDVCSGVRTNGKLDEQKLSSFFSQIQS